MIPPISSPVTSSTPDSARTSVSAAASVVSVVDVEVAVAFESSPCSWRSLRRRSRACDARARLPPVSASIPLEEVSAPARRAAIPSGGFAGAPLRPIRGDDRHDRLRAHLRLRALARLRVHVRASNWIGAFGERGLRLDGVVGCGRGATVVGIVGDPRRLQRLLQGGGGVAGDLEAEAVELFETPRACRRQTRR